MRLDKAAHQQKRPFPISSLKEINTSIHNPCCVMQMRWQLGWLRNVIHLAPDPLRIMNMLVSVLVQITL
ncbi:hypothetical protein, partial [Paenibacillus soyae]